MSLRHLLLATLFIGLASCDTDTTDSQELAPPVVASPDSESVDDPADIAAVEQEAIETVEESAALEAPVEEEEILIATVAVTFVASPPLRARVLRPTKSR